MRSKIFSIYDTKVQAFGVPFFSSHEQHAYRMMSMAVSDGTTQLGAFPSDFMLFELGEFDDQTAEFDLLVSPKAHGPLSNFKDNDK